jgi:hypothetical protein
VATVSLNVDFELGSNGTPSSLVDLSTKVSKVDFPREQDNLDVTAFNGNGTRAFAVGLSQGSFDVEFFWDTTVDGQIAGLLGYTTAVNFQYGPDGTTTGRPKYTGSCFLKSFTIPATIGEVKKFSGTFQVTGAVTRATY